MTYSEFLDKEPEALRRKVRALLGGYADTAAVAVQWVKAGDTVLNQGDHRSDIVMLLSGRVSIVSQHAGYTTYAFDEFTPVCMFGEQEALSGKVHIEADVRAKTNCRFLVLHEADYLRWIQSDTTIMQRRVRSIITTLMSQVTRQRGALFLSSHQRMQQFLAAYWERHAKAAAGGVLAVRQTRQAIAEETGFSLRTVNRIIHQMQTEGEISLNKGKITMTENQYEALKAKSIQ